MSNLFVVADCTCLEMAMPWAPALAILSRDPKCKRAGGVSAPGPRNKLQCTRNRSLPCEKSGDAESHERCCKVEYRLPFKW
jgi:hypothetical protein